MKKSLIVVAVAASFASVAHAQSSVTLYGLLDAGVTYTSNVAHNSKWAAGSGGIEQSRFGLRGSEDLGGGLKAIFTLESGFNVNNGRFANNNGMFNRQAFVGLSSAQFGTVTLGRQYDAAQDFLAPLTATGSWGGTYFAHPFNNDNLNTNGGFAVNNSVKYSSANYAGFTFGGTYGFSNQAGAFANNREYSSVLLTSGKVCVWALLTHSRTTRAQRTLLARLATAARPTAASWAQRATSVNVNSAQQVRTLSARQLSVWHGRNRVSTTLQAFSNRCALTTTKSTASTT